MFGFGFLLGLSFYDTPCGWSDRNTLQSCAVLECTAMFHVAGNFFHSTDCMCSPTSN